MTWLQSRFASVNAAVLFIALLFFGWLWGVWVLLGAPLVAIVKAVFDRVESLEPMASCSHASVPEFAAPGRPSAFDCACVRLRTETFAAAADTACRPTA